MSRSTCTRRRGLADLLSSELVTAQNLVDGGLLPSTVDIDDLLSLNLVTPVQLVETGLATEEDMEESDRPDVGLVSLHGALLDDEDPDSTLITIEDLAAQGFFTNDLDRQSLIDAELVTAESLDPAGLTGDPLAVIDLLASELVTAEGLARAGFIERTVSSEDLIGPGFVTATGVALTAQQLAEARSRA